VESRGVNQVIILSTGIGRLEALGRRLLIAVHPSRFWEDVVDSIGVAAMEKCIIQSKLESSVSSTPCELNAHFHILHSNFVSQRGGNFDIAPG
jgi:hypothetical protein